ncbi:hypothetical protein KGQ20_22965 [Catenulispora sp. NF23]|uniref:hypothetical protein n=1 Tax=Catenulispora pinistramenti TaxID=2705254 RepID=UPI001BA75E68|nr:hypothetical protein [Catenulispora pinistramenti]MBS2535627.1 hypothetical protein [Catenulispora pinistramenti]
MTELEDTLSRALAVEADRHRPPVFDAQRIAEAAVTRRRFWRRPLFALVAAAIGVGGIGGATVLTTGGGQHRSADRVSVTFQTKTGSVGSQVTDASVESWVHTRASIEGLKDVTVTVRHSPWRLEVTGHAADLARLKTLGEPGILQFRPVLDHFGEVPPSRTCTVSTVRTGAPWRSCDLDGKPAAWIADPVGVGYHVADAQVSRLDMGGTWGTRWQVSLRFDTAGANDFTGFTTQFADRMSAVLIDGAMESSFVSRKPLADGPSGIEFETTNQAQAYLVAAILSTQGPADLEGATMTVSTR